MRHRGVAGSGMARHLSRCWGLSWCSFSITLAKMFVNMNPVGSSSGLILPPFPFSLMPPHWLKGFSTCSASPHALLPFPSGLYRCHHQAPDCLFLSHHLLIRQPDWLNERRSWQRLDSEQGRLCIARKTQKSIAIILTTDRQEGPATMYRVGNGA